MLELIINLGAKGAIGLLVGLVLVWWIGVESPGGIFIVVIFCVAVAVIVAAIFRLFRRKPGKEQSPTINTALNVSQTYFGSGKSEAEINEFLDGIEVKFLPDGNAVLMSRLNYYIGRKKANLRIVVPKGFMTDFASIPWVVQWLVRKHGPHNGPAVLHDWLYQTHKVGFWLANAIMYDAMVEARVVYWRRALIYFAVSTPFAAYAYWTGPSRLKQTSPELAEQHIITDMAVAVADSSPAEGEPG